MAPPPSSALIVPGMVCTSMVIVTVGIGSLVEVAAGVEVGFVGVAAGFVAVEVLVAVFSVSSVGVAERVSSTLEVLVGLGVFEGRTVFVVVGGRLGVREGIAVGCVEGVGVEVLTVWGVVSGKPFPIKLKRVPVKTSSMTPLRIRPRFDGRSRNTSRAIRPRMLASMKCVAKTRIPSGQMPSTPEPRPKPLALMGK